VKIASDKNAAIQRPTGEQFKIFPRAPAKRAGRVKEHMEHYTGLDGDRLPGWAIKALERR
jgi:hypothetical protein